MVKRISSAQAKARLSTLIAQVAFGGEHYVIERHGKPLAALVRVDELERLEEVAAPAQSRRGALALIGAWRDVDDEDLDAALIDIYIERTKDAGRPVALEG